MSGSILTNWKKQRSMMINGPFILEFIGQDHVKSPQFTFSLNKAQSILTWSGLRPCITIAFAGYLFGQLKYFFVYCDGSMPGSGGSSTASKKLSRALIFNCPFLFFLSFPFFDRVKVICTNVCNLSCLIVFGWLDPIGYCYTALLGLWALFPKQCCTTIVYYNTIIKTTTMKSIQSYWYYLSSVQSNLLLLKLL